MRLVEALNLLREVPLLWWGLPRVTLWRQASRVKRNSLMLQEHFLRKDLLLSRREVNKPFLYW